MCWTARVTEGGFMVTCIATAGSGSGRLPPVHRADSYRTGLGGLQPVPFVSSTPSGRAAKLHTYGELADATHIPTPILIWLPTAGREASVRQALAGEGRWSTVQFRVATASPTLGNGPADAALLPLGHTRPCRRLIDLTDLDARMPQPTGPTH
jgi:hypothetical protein